ncbi:hypothetical protein EMIT0P100_40025 [Pseudomonas sp. IT-P100]
MAAQQSHNQTTLFYLPDAAVWIGSPSASRGSKLPRHESGRQRLSLLEFSAHKLILKSYLFSDSYII